MVQRIDWWIFKIQQWFAMQMGTENMVWKIKSFLPPLKVFYPTYDDFEGLHTELYKNIDFSAGFWIKSLTFQVGSKNKT